MTTWRTGRVTIKRIQERGLKFIMVNHSVSLNHVVFSSNYSDKMVSDINRLSGRIWHAQK
jgi:triosephosphate isomerase